MTKRFYCHLKLLCKYGLAGLSATLLELVVLDWLARRHGWWYLYASAAAFVIGFILSFIFRKLWAFKSVEWRDWHHQALWYALFLTFGLFGNLFLMFFLVSRHAWPYLLAQLFVGLVVGGVGFVFNTQITFKRSPAVREIDEEDETSNF